MATPSYAIRQKVLAIAYHDPENIEKSMAIINADQDDDYYHENN